MPARPLGDYDGNNDVKRARPAAGIFDAPTVTVSINRQWASHVAGLLHELTDENVWLGDETEQEDAAAEIIKLLAALGS